MVEVLSSYKFFEDPSQPTYQKLLLRHELDKYGEGVVYFECDDLNERHKMRHRAKKARYMEIEVMFSLQKITQNSALISFFKQQNPCLSWGGTFDHFTNYMSTLETPLPHDVISYFGKQESNGVFMAGNCAFVDGRFLTHDDVNMTVIPQYFSQSLMPLHPREYPRHVLIPFPHVRYILCSQVMNDIMPRFFANNLLPAQAVLSMGVMGLYADQIWKGKSGVGHGMPFGWVYSTEPNTGKTEAVTLAHCMLGMHKRPLWAGDATKPALFERLSQQANLTLAVDDVVAKKNESQAYAQLGRALYDQSQRSVCGKSRTALSSALFTANAKINIEDDAFQSRLIQIRFDKLLAQGVEDPCLYTDWNNCKELISALAPDFATLTLENGQLDDMAIKDCAKFMQMAVGKQRDRNANLWGMLLYFMVQIRLLFQSSCESLESVIEYCVTEAVQHSQVHFSAPSLLEQFIIAVSRLRADSASFGTANPLGPIERTIFWDKLRTNVRPVLYGGTTHYVSLRLEPCIEVIKLVLNKQFDASELYSAVRKSDYALVSDGQFYDVSKGPWPICRLEDNGAGMMTRIPCLENDPGMLEYVHKFPAIFIVQNYYNEIVQKVKVQGGANTVAYKEIIIESSNHEQEDYNFYTTVTGRGEDGWFGFRALAYSSFAHFCGVKNLMHIGSETTHITYSLTLERENVKEGYGKLMDLYTPDSLLKFFGYEPIQDLRLLPIGYKKYPCRFENADHHETPPDPMEFVEADYVGGSDNSMQDDEQTKTVSEQAYESDDPGSTLGSGPRSEASDDSELHLPQPKSARASSRVIDDEEEEEAADEDEQVCG